MDDSSIIALYNARDERAITETSDKYGKYCYKIAYNILTDEQDTEECLNDSWLGAWNTIPPSCPDSLKHYLTKIVRNLSFDRFRRKMRKKRIGDEMYVALEEIEEFTESTSDIDGELGMRELERALNAFLRDLPAKERNIFLRRYYFVDAIPDIAKRYSMRENNVVVTLFRTRKKLKQYLEEEGYKV